MSALLPPFPDRPGAYRWWYADVACGDVTAVFILLVGSLFSPRYAARAARGARPLEHCAVNFALYERGVRKQWVLSEWPTAAIDGDAVHIGHSCLEHHPDGTVEIFLRERLAPFGGLTKAHLSLRRTAPGHPPVTLESDGRHEWEARMPRADAVLRLPLLGRVLTGHGYHDTNAGEAPLGPTLPSWTWTRVHAPDATHIDYRLPRGERLAVTVRPAGTTLVREPAPTLPTVRTSWGLDVPRILEAGGVSVPAPSLVESSPFYARLVGRLGEVHGVAEVANFRRFRSPLVRWMAHFRTRIERETARTPALQGAA